MKIELFRSNAKVVQHLDRFSVLKRQVLSLTLRFHEVLVDDLAKAPPSGSMIHDQEMIAPDDQVMRDV